jgi:hypothetical protein
MPQQYLAWDDGPPGFIKQFVLNDVTILSTIQ